MIKEINIGFLTISVYALCILTGALIAYFFIRKEWKYKGYPIRDISDFFFNVLLIGIVGARIWYVVFSWSLYQNNILNVFRIDQGGLAFHGGLVAGVAYGIYFFKKRNYDLLDVCDTVIPYILIAQAIGRWGNFFNQEAYGGAVNYSFLKGLMIPNFIIDNMFINGEYHHPTFLYESFLCIVAFVIIRLMIRFVPLRKGQSALLYGILYSSGRIYIEGLRTDSLVVANLRVAQLTSIIIIIVCLVLFVKTSKEQELNTLQVRRNKNG